MDELKIGRAVTVQDPAHRRNGTTVEVIGGRDLNGQYPVREQNGSCYLLTAEQLGIKEELVEKETYLDGFSGRKKKGKMLQKFK